MARTPKTSPNSPERVVLWLEKGPSNKVYIAERDGAQWIARYGKRTQETRAEKIYTLPTPEAAEKSFLKAIAAKEKEGYHRAPTRDEAKKIIKKALGLDVEERDGKVVITSVDKRPDTSWVERGGTIQKFACGKYLYITVLEEIAIVAETLKGTEVFMDVDHGDSTITSSTITIR